jgi:hypothetical protein
VHLTTSLGLHYHRDVNRKIDHLSQNVEKIRQRVEECRLSQAGTSSEMVVVRGCDGSAGLADPNFLSCSMFRHHPAILRVMGMELVFFDRLPHFLFLPSCLATVILVG